MKKDGRCRFVGFSTHAATRVILAAIETGAFDYVNLHWYFVNDFTWPAVEAATRHDMGVFIISPSDKGGKLYEPPGKLVTLCAPLTPIAFEPAGRSKARPVRVACVAPDPAEPFVVLAIDIVTTTLPPTSAKESVASAVAPVSSVLPFVGE